MIRRAIVWAVAILQALANVLPWRLGVAWAGGWAGWRTPCFPARDAGR
jgi:hypothetical protein